MEIKICSRCNRRLLIDKFNIRKRNGKESLSPYCRDCNKEYQREHYKKHKIKYILKNKNRKNSIKEWFKNYKLNLKCKKCGEKHIATLDFHHVDSSKKDFNIGSIVNQGYSLEKILNEVSKCIVLCSNCHRVLHFEEKNQGAIV